MADDDKAPEVPKGPTVEELQAKLDDMIKTNNGLNRKNRELKDSLDEKTEAGRSVEERIAALEADKVKAERRAATVSAFAEAGVPDEFRRVFDIDDPTERASAMRDLLEDRDRATTKRVASEFNRNPDEMGKDSGKVVRMEDLKNMDPKEINALWEEGRVAGQ